MSDKDVYIGHLENTIKDLQNQVNSLTEMILLLCEEKFGSSSEKTKEQIQGQLSLFNEAEVEATSDADEPLIIRKSAVFHRNNKINREELLKDLHVIEIPCILSDDELICCQCGGEMKQITFNKVRDELEYVPAKVCIVRYMQQVRECPACKNKNRPFIRKAETPTSVLNHSFASPSSIARIMYAQNQRPYMENYLLDGRCSISNNAAENSSFCDYVL